MLRKTKLGWKLAELGAVCVVVIAFAGEGKTADNDAATPTRWRLLTVPNSPEVSSVLLNPRVRVVARYEAFTLVEATGPEVNKLVELGGDVRDDMRQVRIGKHTFDPKVAGPYLLAKTGQAPRIANKGGHGLVVVQYVGPLKKDWIQSVRATGVEVVQYMAQNAHLVIGDRGALSALEALSKNRDQGFLRAVVPYSPSAKIRPDMMQRSGMTKLVISTVAGARGEAARAEIARQSTPDGTLVNVAGIVQQPVTMDAARIAELAELGAVVAIEPFVEPKLHDERGTMTIAGALNANFQPVLGAGYLAYLASKGFPSDSPIIVDVTDSGIDKGVVPAPSGSHPVFYVGGNDANASRIVYAQEATAADTDARDCGGHGTNVASIITGHNSGTGATHEDANGFNYGLGVQPFGKVGATKIFKCSGGFDVTTSISALHSSAFGFGARISNNSWGAVVDGIYNARSQEFDALVRDAQSGTAGNQQFTEVVSAGNSGSWSNTIGSPGTAKNVITVGASENARPIAGSDGCSVTDAMADKARDIVNFSSRGPTDDGRIKPDIVSPGTHVSGAQSKDAGYTGNGTCNPAFPAGSTLYNLVSGTSQAAPGATGFASLIHTWYQTNFGGGVTFPSPAMTKALMINTATDLVGGDAGDGTLNKNVPTQIQGWGRINLGTLLDGTSRRVVDQSQIFNVTGAVSERFFRVGSTTKPLRVSLVWTDPPGPTTGNSFVNDLDLEVTAGGQVFKGNVFSAGRSVAGGTADPRNNVENVFLPAGIQGAVKVRVVAKNIAGDGVPGVGDTTDQDYALVVSNVTGPVPSLGVLANAGSTVKPFGDGDATLEKGEPFQLTLRLKNVGNANIGKFSAHLTAPATEATITKATSNWVAIPPNTTKANSPVFTGTVKPGVACGKVVHMTVAGTAAGSPFRIPVNVQMGKPGPAATFPSTDVPKSIPDGNTTGVDSIRMLAGTGVISNMQVKINSITHTFVADLRIELTSPDGTTVRLFDGYGGSADNLIDTVFSDAALTPISAAAAPFTGTFKPSEPLAVFNGKPAAGNWKLTVRDRETPDPGTLNGWSLIRKLYVCN